MVECDLAKVEVAGSNPVSRSIFLAWPLAGGVAMTPRDRELARCLLWIPTGAVAKW